MVPIGSPYGSTRQGVMPHYMACGASYRGTFQKPFALAKPAVVPSASIRLTANNFAFMTVLLRR